MNIVTEKLDQIYFLDSQFPISEFYSDMDKINQIITEGFISNKFDKVKSAFKHNIKTAETFLLDKGVDVKRLKRDALYLSKTVKNDFKSRKDPKEIQRKVISYSYKVIKREAVSVIHHTTLTEKILTSLFIFIGAVFFNTFFSTVAAILFGPELAMVILATVIAPLVEEYAKKISIEEGYPWIYTGIFAGLELLQYVIANVASGGLLVPTLIVRISALMIHFSTTYIQKYFQEKGKDEYSGIDYTTLGYFIGVAIHCTWNVMGLIFNEPIKSFVTGG